MLMGCRCRWSFRPLVLFIKSIYIYLWLVGLPGPRHMAMEANTLFSLSRNSRSGLGNYLKIKKKKYIFIWRSFLKRSLDHLNHLNLKYQEIREKLCSLHSENHNALCGLKSLNGQSVARNNKVIHFHHHQEFLWANQNAAKNGLINIRFGSRFF